MLEWMSSHAWAKGFQFALLLRKQIHLYGSVWNCSLSPGSAAVPHGPCSLKQFVSVNLVRRPFLWDRALLQHFHHIDSSHRRDWLTQHLNCHNCTCLKWSFLWAKIILHLPGVVHSSVPRICKSASVAQVVGTSQHRHSSSLSERE